MSSRRSKKARSRQAVAKREDHRWKRVLAPLGIFAWALGCQWLFLRSELLLDSPISPLFFGDSVHFLETARALAEGRTLASGLPFHPPATTWLLWPLWSFFDDPAQVYVASKILMAVLGALTVLGLFLLLRKRIEHADLFCLLLPLSFGEMLLGSATNSEILYRLLLVALLGLGSRWPVLGGLLHGLATLTRAEHLLLGLLLLLVGLARPASRRFASISLVAALAVLLPWSMNTHRALSDYNETLADELVEPLPEWVPVSFYGPLNFALAQREPEIYFSRRTLPIPRDEASSLDPTDPTHNAYVVHGYRIGFQEIFRDPVRFAERTASKLAFSLRGLAWGWTARDFPKSGPWVRRPVDMASASAPIYASLLLGLAGWGAWKERKNRNLLIVGLGLVLYRLTMNAAFFPYLRSMTIASPAVLLFAVLGITSLFQRFARPCLLAFLLLVAGYHLSMGWQIRDYRLAGERDGEGRIIDDRTVTLEFVGYREPS